MSLGHVTCYQPIRERIQNQQPIKIKQLLILVVLTGFRAKGKVGTSKKQPQKALFLQAYETPSAKLYQTFVQVLMSDIQHAMTTLSVFCTKSTSWS